MQFILGTITGLLISVLVFVVEERLSKKELSITKIVKNRIEGKPVRENFEGGIVGTDEELERFNGVLEKNAKAGRDTKLSELI